MIMQIGILIIGDEILSGKRQDKHLAHVIGALKARGLELSFAEYIGDVPTQIVATLRRTLDSGALVFSFGGIGATPDDHTRACAAEAAGVALLRDPRAVAEIEAQFGAEAHPKRVLMADLPDGCDLIPNPINRIPGFSLGNHHFLPGFPEMSWPMLDWLLDEQYPHLHNTRPDVEVLILVHDVRESRLIDLMNGFVARHPDIRLSSLPRFLPDGGGEVELGLKGRVGLVQAAAEEVEQELSQLGLQFVRRHHL